MSYLAYKESGFDSKRVIGMAGVLDASRMNLMLSRSVGKPIKKIDSLVLGTHGDTMVAVISQSKVAGKRLEDILDKNDISEVMLEIWENDRRSPGFNKTKTFF